MSEDLVKIAVLEQRLVDFSKIVTKIDDAITKLIDVNSNITKMLAVHEERIEQCHKSDDLIIKMINDFKNENIREHLEVTKRIDEIETKVDEISKFKWMAAGIISIVVLISPIVSDYIFSIVPQENVHRTNQK